MILYQTCTRYALPDLFVDAIDWFHASVFCDGWTLDREL